MPEDPSASEDGKEILAEHRKPRQPSTLSGPRITSVDDLSPSWLCSRMVGYSAADQGTDSRLQAANASRVADQYPVEPSTPAPEKPGTPRARAAAMSREETSAQKDER